jgi:cytochrome c oxidase subunit 2
VAPEVELMNQSALEPAGRGAERIADLFWGMTIGGAILWLAVVGLALYAAQAREEHGRDRGLLLIVGGGVVLPTIVLAGLLVYSLSLLPSFLAPTPHGALEIEVVGYQWWWRVRYLREGRAPIELANELRLPMGRPAVLQLESRDVIHSFWVPALGGKVDMIPGRRTRLLLEPTKTGTYRGVCAEYCGASHALMSLYVVVQDRSEFERWLSQQDRPAAPPGGALAQRGQALFTEHGCGACHAVRGSTADGVVGPDLTHLATRLSLAAGTLRNEPRALRRFIARTGEIKPSAHMPAFGMLPARDLDALAAYLGSDAP